VSAVHRRSSTHLAAPVQGHSTRPPSILRSASIAVEEPPQTPGPQQSQSTGDLGGNSTDQNNVAVTSGTPQDHHPYNASQIQAQTSGSISRRQRKNSRLKGRSKEDAHYSGAVESTAQTKVVELSQTKRPSSRDKHKEI